MQEIQRRSDTSLRTGESRRQAGERLAQAIARPPVLRSQSRRARGKSRLGRLRRRSLRCAPTLPVADSAFGSRALAWPNRLPGRALLRVPAYPATRKDFPAPADRRLPATAPGLIEAAASCSWEIFRSRRWPSLG